MLRKENSIKSHGTIKVSKAYGAVGVLALSGALALGGVSVSADSVEGTSTATATEAVAPTNTVTEAQLTEAKEAVDTTHSAVLAQDSTVKEAEASLEANRAEVASLDTQIAEVKEVDSQAVAEAKEAVTRAELALGNQSVEAVETKVADASQALADSIKAVSDAEQDLALAERGTEVTETVTETVEVPAEGAKSVLANTGFSWDDDVLRPIAVNDDYIQAIKNLANGTGTADAVDAAVKKGTQGVFGESFSLPTLNDNLRSLSQEEQSLTTKYDIREPLPAELSRNLSLYGAAVINHVRSLFGQPLLEVSEATAAFANKYQSVQETDRHRDFTFDEVINTVGKGLNNTKIYSGAYWLNNGSDSFVGGGIFPTEGQLYNIMYNAIVSDLFSVGSSYRHTLDLLGFTSNAKQFAIMTDVHYGAHEIPLAGVKLALADSASPALANPYEVRAGGTSTTKQVTKEVTRTVVDPAAVSNAKATLSAAQATKIGAETRLESAQNELASVRSLARAVKEAKDLYTSLAQAVSSRQETLARLMTAKVAAEEGVERQAALVVAEREELNRLMGAYENALAKYASLKEAYDAQPKPEKHHEVGTGVTASKPVYELPKVQDHGTLGGDSQIGVGSQNGGALGGNKKPSTTVGTQKDKTDKVDTLGMKPSKSDMKTPQYMGSHTTYGQGMPAKAVSTVRNNQASKQAIPTANSLPKTGTNNSILTLLDTASISLVSLVGLKKKRG
ncbi:LPXTG cell wall anchor domain-containing protein [Streptococcus pneumoniae]